MAGASCSRSLLDNDWNGNRLTPPAVLAKGDEPLEDEDPAESRGAQALADLSAELGAALLSEAENLVGQVGVELALHGGERLPERLQVARVAALLQNVGVSRCAHVVRLQGCKDIHWNCRGHRARFKCSRQNFIRRDFA